MFLNVAKSKIAQKSRFYSYYGIYNDVFALTSHAYYNPLTDGTYTIITFFQNFSNLCRNLA